MGRRSRQKRGPVETTDYTDPDGNVLSLRNAISAGTARTLDEPVGGAAASVDDQWRRRTEMLFERFAVRWEIAGLPMTRQSELLGRYRFADQATQNWVRETIDRHIARGQTP